MTPSRHSEVRTRPDRATRVAPAGRARAEERAVAEVGGVAAGAIGRSSRREPVEEAFGVEPAKELDGDENVSICGSRDDRRRKIVATYYSKGVARPAEAYTDAGLCGKPHFISVNQRDKQNVGGASSCPTDTCRNRVTARTSAVSARRWLGRWIVREESGASLRRRDPGG